MFLIFAIIFGIAYGGAMSLQALVVVELFGLHSGGVIIGTVVFAYTIGAACGSVISGYLFDMMGSYGYSFGVANILSIIAFVLSMMVVIPPKKVMSYHQRTYRGRSGCGG